MRKKVLKNIVVSTLLTGSSLFAQSSSILDTSKSLVGFEGGIGGVDVQSSAISDGYESVGHGGLKIGAQTEDYRLFLSGRYYRGDNFDSISTVGVELQYLFHIASFADFFIGANAGLASISYTDVANVDREVSNMYYGGGAGLNFMLSDLVDFEIGARIMSLQEADNTIGGVTYTFDDIVSGYASIIFKYEMD